MTAVLNFSANNSRNNNSLRDYQVEVVTFDGESEILYIEACDEYRAQQIAATRVANADYIMVHAF